MCDNQLFVKLTARGKALVRERHQEGVHYPGAKRALLIGAEELDDGERLSELIWITATSLRRGQAGLTSVGPGLHVHPEA